MDATEARTFRGFLTIWIAQAISLLGSQAVQFALVWWLTVRTGSAAILAAATLLALAPAAILGPFIGTLVDRWNRKTIMILADAGLATSSVGLAWLFATDQAAPAHVLVLLLLRSIGGSFHETSMLASTSLMVPERHLTRVQGLNQALQGGMLILGPPLGALLYGSFSMGGVMLFDVGTAAIAILPLLFVFVPQPRREATAEGGQAASVWAETVSGFRYLAERRGHLGLLAIAALVNLALIPAFSLLPLLVHEQGGDATRMGLVSSSFGVGMLAGGVLLGIWGGFRRRILTTLFGMALVGVAVIGVGNVPTASPWFLVMLLAAAAAATLTNGPIQAILQATIAPEYQGRIFTLYRSLATAVTPLGLVFAAPLAEWLGVAAWLMIGGGITLLSAGVACLVPSILEIEGAASPVTTCEGEATDRSETAA